MIVFNSQGFSAEQISKWVQDRADVQVREKKSSELIRKMFCLDSCISSTQLFRIFINRITCNNDWWSSLYQTQ